MIDPNTTPALDTVTPEIAKAKLQLALTSAEMSIQAIQTKADSLVYNEDNLAVIKDFITDLKKVNTTIDDAHEIGKAPAWAICKAWDVAKRDLKAITDGILTKAEGKHTVLCQAVEKKDREAKAETKRKADIEEKINTTIMGFSQEITTCKTTPELISIQSRINALQGKKTVYQEFLPNLVERCAELNPLLKDQKESIKRLEDLEMEEKQALETGDDETLLRVTNDKEVVESKIHENKTRIEESAINSSIASSSSASQATQIFPEVKAKRRTWKYSVGSLAALYKKLPDFITLTPNEEKIKQLLKQKIEDGETKDVEEIDHLGVIRFFVDKKYS